MSFWKKFFGKDDKPNSISEPTMSETEKLKDENVLRCPLCKRDYHIGIDSTIISIDVSMQELGAIALDNNVWKQPDLVGSASNAESLALGITALKAAREKIANGEKNTGIVKNVIMRKIQHHIKNAAAQTSVVVRENW